MSRKDRPVPVTKRRKLSHSSEQELVDKRFAGVDGAESDDASSSQDESGPQQQRASAKSAKPLTRSRKSSNSAAALAPNTSIGTSSTLSSQVKELLRETTPNFDARSRKSASVTQKVIEAVKDLSKQGPFTAPAAEAYIRKHGNVAIPWPLPRPSKESNVKYEYGAPAAIKITGPSALRLGIKSSDEVRISVQMPSQLLQDKDYLNLRAFHKRAFYLARIAVGLSDSLESDFEFQYDRLDGLELLPVLNLTPKEPSKSRSHPTIYVICVDLPHNSFDLEKLSPVKNCVRAGSGSTNGPAAPTPFYNSCLQLTASGGVFDELLTAASRQCAGFADACRLGQSWLAQRAFSSAVSDGGFGWWEWAVVCAILLQVGGPRGQPLFSERYTSLQLFKAMLQVLATRDLMQPWVVRGSPIDIKPSDAPVLFDNTTGVNLLFKMRGSSYQILRLHAQSSLVMVNSKQDDDFDSTFINRVAEPSLHSDEVYSFNLKVDNGAPGQLDMITKLYTTLTRGLGDRATSLDIKASASPLWSLDLVQPKVKASRVRVCLSVDPENASRLVDHGPSAEEQEAATDFQRFWGPKSELRRFKDGSITESLVWESTMPVTLQIIQYLLQRHFQVEANTIKSEQGRLEAAMLPAAVISAKDAFALIHQKYMSLSSTLHALTDLPLPVRSVSPASQVLRSTTLTTPLAISTATPIDVLIQFDSSSRWPDSLPAIQHTKIAFLLKLGDALSNQDTSLTTRLGLENTSTASSGTLNTAFLDIIYLAPAPGLAPLIFRLRIHHDRELHLLQTSLADTSLHGATRDAVASAVATHKRTFLATSAHTTALRPLMTRFPALSPTIRLLKKWISSHLLSQHIPDEPLELIAVHIFTHPAPWSVPGSATTAFLRCLWFLAKWDWAATPLIVDMSLSQDMSGEQRGELRTRFEAWRKLDPNMNQVSWFVGSAVDETGVVWTGGGRVEKVVAGRVTALAAACVDVVKGGSGSGGGSGGLGEEVGKGLFVSGLGEYDFLISLDKHVVKGGLGKRSKGKGKYRNLEVAEETDVDAVGFDPVQDYLVDLEAAFKGVALFFYGASGDGGDVIAGLWRPAVKGRREWKVRLGWSSVPIREKVEVEGELKVMAEVNTKAMLKEIEIMGEGLFKEVKSQE